MKEFGEGVDRMCKELEAIGLPDPVFDNNTFILKTTIMSSSYQKLPIQFKTAMVKNKNCRLNFLEMLFYKLVQIKTIMSQQLII